MEQTDLRGAWRDALVIPRRSLLASITVVGEGVVVDGSREMEVENTLPLHCRSWALATWTFSICIC